MEKVGLVTDNNTLSTGLSIISVKRNMEINRIALSELLNLSAKGEIPGVLVADITEATLDECDILESFCIENPEILFIILTDTEITNFLRSYSYLVLPRSTPHNVIVDITANALAYSGLLLRVGKQQEFKISEIKDAKSILDQRRHKDLLIARNGELLIQKERLIREREKLEEGVDDLIELILRSVEFFMPELVLHLRSVAKLV
jgi:hypothetical protein